MTKEEQWIKESIENYIFAYTGKRAKISDADAQHFTASVMSYLNLCTPSLPSNLDEAADAYTDSQQGDYPFSEGMDNFCYGDIHRAFKAGAGWMAGRGINAESEVCKLAERAWVTPIDEKQLQRDLYDNFVAGDKVIVQIRKK